MVYFTNLQRSGDFLLGFLLAILLSMFILEIFIFAAYYQPENFAATYKDIFCYNLK